MCALSSRERHTREAFAAALHGSGNCHCGAVHCINAVSVPESDSAGSAYPTKSESVFSDSLGHSIRSIERVSCPGGSSLVSLVEHVSHQASGSERPHTAEVNWVGAPVLASSGGSTGGSRRRRRRSCAAVRNNCSSRVAVWSGWALIFSVRSFRQLCASSSAKGDQVRVGKKGEAYSQTPEARLRQLEPRRDTARALTLSQSNRFVKKPSHSL